MPEGGVYSGTGVDEGVFDPAIGAGTYEITYTFTDEEGCTASASKFITVLSTSENAITGFVLVNAETDEDIMALTEGSVINLFNLTTSKINIRAEATSDVESVRLKLSGDLVRNRTENVAPYALFGDRSGDYFPGELPVGEYHLMATPYSENRLRGTAGTPMMINFSVISDGAGPLKASLYPNPAIYELQVELTENKKNSKLASIQIHDMQGRLLRSYNASEISQKAEFKIPVYTLTQGVYFMTITDDKGRVTKKSFVVNK